MTRFLSFLSFAIWLTAAHAQLSIEITGAGAQRIPIALVPFAGESALAPAISSIVRADLERSGLFRGLEWMIARWTGARPQRNDHEWLRRFGRRIVGRKQRTA